MTFDVVNTYISVCVCVCVCVAIKKPTGAGGRAPTPVGEAPPPTAVWGSGILACCFCIKLYLDISISRANIKSMWCACA